MRKRGFSRAGCGKARGARSGTYLNLHSQGFVEAGYQSTKAYLRFDLTGINKGLLDAATLRLTLVSNTLGYEGATDGPATQYRYSVWGLADGYAGGTNNNSDRDGGVADLGPTWGETVINWANAPGHDCVDVAAGPWFSYNPPGDGVNDALLFGGNRSFRLGTFEITGVGTPGQQFDISSPNLLSFLQADTDNLVTMIVLWTEKNIGGGWGIPGQVPGGQTWKGNSRNGETNLASRENTIYDPPTLLLNVVPEPAALALFGLGALLAVRRRRPA